MKKVSIIIPIYNVEKYLSECLNSVINQTYHNIEIVLVNDGSTDNSLQICKKYQKNDSRIIIINKTNGGLSDARNEGLKIASGEFITFIDSDDYIDVLMINEMMQAVESYNADVVCCGFKRVSDDKKILEEEKVKKIEVLNNFDSMSELLMQRKIKTQAWGKLFKSSLLSKLYFEKGKYHEDVFIMHQILGKINISVSLPKSLYFYRWNTNSITNQRFNIKHQHIIEAQMLRLEYISKNYPTLKILQLNMLVWCCCSNNYKIMKSKSLRTYKQYLVCNTQIIRRNIKSFLFSDFSVKSKLMALASCIVSLFLRESNNENTICL